MGYFYFSEKKVYYLFSRTQTSTSLLTFLLLPLEINHFTNEHCMRSLYECIKQISQVLPLVIYHSFTGQIISIITWSRFLSFPFEINHFGNHHSVRSLYESTTEISQVSENIGVSQFHWSDIPNYNVVQVRLYLNLVSHGLLLFHREKSV